MKFRQIKTDEVKIGKRHRKDMGDLQALADSIEAEGLLHPIGVNADMGLVFGERRLRAVRDNLGWDRLPAVLVSVSSIVAGECAENEMRKDFTVSERVAIGEAMETIEREAAKERQKRKPKDSVQETVPEQNGQQARDVVAKKSGLGTGKTYEAAKKVVAKGTPALVQAMDAGEVPISVAANVAELPKADQVAAVKHGKSAIRQAAKAGQARRAGHPVARPPKKYQASDSMDVILQNVVGVLSMIRRDYGGWQKMIARSDWDKSQTNGIRDLLNAIEVAIVKFNKEAG